MRVPTTALVACSFALAGCLEVTSTRLGPPGLGYDRPRLDPDRIAVYRTEDQIPGEYQEVALLHATGSEAWSTEGEVYRKLREEAARLGANALVLQPVRELSPRERVAARRLNLDMGREGRALAIYVLPKPGGPWVGPPARSSPGSGASPATPEPTVAAAYFFQMEDGTTLDVAYAEPAGTGQIQVVLPDGTARYLNASRIRSISDPEGKDWTGWTLDERKKLPRITALF